MIGRFGRHVSFRPTGYFIVFSEILGATAVFLAIFQMLWLPWSTGETTYLSISGYLPWSDASWWFSGGLRLLLDGKLDGLSATRIVNEVFFAGLLGIANEHLQIALILRAILIVAAMFLFVREVGYRLGIASAAVTTIVMIAFIGRFMRTMMSEPTGFLYGVLGATLLLAGADDQKPGLFATGVFLVALGLAARPGPFLVLPLLVLWAGRCFRGEGRFGITPTLWAAAGLASGIAVAALLNRLCTLPGTVPFSNFAYTLYGLAEGGQPWTIALSELKHVPGPLPTVATKQAVAMIRANPVLFLAGMWSFVLRFLKDQLLYVNSYPWECCSAYRYTQWYRAPFVVLEAIGLIYALRPSRTTIEELCVLTFVGCTFSSAFTFWNADAYRTFASTNALQALFVGLGAWAICRGFGLHPTGGHHFASSAKAAFFLSTSIVVLSLFTPLIAAIVRLHSRSRLVPVSWCAKGSAPIVIDLGRSSPFLRILPPGSRGFVPNVAEDKFLQDKTFNGIGIAQKLATLRSGDLLVLAHDLSGLNDRTVASKYYPIWLIIPGATGLATPVKYRVCANRDDIPTEWGMQSVFTAQKIEPVEQTMACAASSLDTRSGGRHDEFRRAHALCEVAKETPPRPSFASQLDRRRRLRSEALPGAVALPLPSKNSRSKHENGLVRCSSARTEGAPRSGRQ